jgi:orotate phosphoribosyltransferase-like protein
MADKKVVEYTVAKVRPEDIEINWSKHSNRDNRSSPIASAFLSLRPPQRVPPTSSRLS